MHYQGFFALECIRLCWLHYTMGQRQSCCLQRRLRPGHSELEPLADAAPALKPQCKWCASLD